MTKSCGLSPDEASEDLQKVKDVLLAHAASRGGVGERVSSRRLTYAGMPVIKLGLTPAPFSCCLPVFLHVLMCACTFVSLSR